MPLTTQALTDATCQTSSNPLLTQIWSAVERYNTLPAVAAMNAVQKAEAVKILDHICEKCARYMTDKAYFEFKGGPQGLVTAKRHLRYEAFTGLMGECSREMRALGGRMVSAPDDFRAKQGGENYYLERVDPQHRPGFFLSEHYKKWVHRGQKKTSFWDSMEDVEDDEKADWDAEWSRTGEKPDGYLQVWGYDQSARWDQCVYFDGNVLKYAKDDSPFQSSNKETVNAGKGWAIFVCSMPMVESDATLQFNHYIFSGSHQRGVEHHTSFLAGKPVMAAGEWLVDSTGTIRVLSAKSGHYKPGTAELFNFVTTFQQIPGDALIRVDMVSTPWKYYRVSQLRSNLAAITAGTAAHVPGADVAAVIAQYAPACGAGLKRVTNFAA